MFGPGDEGPSEDELLLLLLLLVESELMLGLWVRLFPDAFRFEPTRLRKREGICPSTLHKAYAPRVEAEGRAGGRRAGTQAQTDTRETQKRKKKREKGRGEDDRVRELQRGSRKGEERTCGWSRMRPERRRRVDQQRRFVTLGTSRSAKALDNRSNNVHPKHNGPMPA